MTATDPAFVQSPRMTTNPLRDYFERNTGRRMYKWMHYFDIYHRHFARFRGTSPSIVEFGVAHGGSLQMWKHYFGPGARLCGIDINPKCRRAEEDGISIIIGNQEDRGFLAELAVRLAPIDVLIDDGGHTMGQQIATFEVMFPAVSQTGVYLAEDLHTSYWDRYGGGIRKPGSFIEYAKRLIDQLNAWHAEDHVLEVDDFTRTAASMTFYDSVLVIEKAPVSPPESRKTGRKLYL